MHARQPDGGFSILEALVAAAITATALVALAHLLVLAGRTSQAARAQSTAVMLAVDKLEELHAGPSDAGGSTAGSDHVDAAGRDLADAARVPFSPVYARQWSAVPLPADGSLLLFEVVVVPSTALDAGGPGARGPGAVTLTSVRAREGP